MHLSGILLSPFPARQVGTILLLLYLLDIGRRSNIVSPPGEKRIAAPFGRDKPNPGSRPRPKFMVLELSRQTAGKGECERGEGGGGLNRKSFRSALNSCQCGIFGAREGRRDGDDIGSQGGGGRG